YIPTPKLGRRVLDPTLALLKPRDRSWTMRIPNWVPIALIGLVAACDTMAPNEPGNLVPRTVTEDLSLPAVELNGTRFHAETFGNPANPVIVFLHGGPGCDYTC